MTVISVDGSRCANADKVALGENLIIYLPRARDVVIWEGMLNEDKIFFFMSTDLDELQGLKELVGSNPDAMKNAFQLATNLDCTDPTVELVIIRWNKHTNKPYLRVKML